MNNPLDTGYGYSNALLGVFDTYTESSARIGADYREAAFEEYVQDSWRVSRQLTLEIGMRLTTRIPVASASGSDVRLQPWRMEPVAGIRALQPGAQRGRTRVAVNPLTGAQLPAVYIGALVPGVGSPSDGMIVVGQPGVPQGLTTWPSVDFGPRFGFAYDVFGDGKTAFGGGFGISYLPTSAPSLCCSGSYQSNPPLSYTPMTYYGTLAYVRKFRWHAVPVQRAGTQRNQAGSSYSFSLGGQRDVGKSIVVDVAVVGNLGRHLLMSQNLNQLPYGERFLASSQDPTDPGKPLPDAFLRPYHGLGTITFREPIGNSSYYALQTQANRRFSQRLGVQS